MESWVLEGDSYSFLRSAPRNFNLEHLDGPNHVEIFDITSIPSHRSAISETTCLCDIFGDDCESPLSSSPASTCFLKRNVDERLPAEDVNDSSGSYHTALGSEYLSDASDTFEDSKDTKDLDLTETKESNSPPSDLTLPNDKNEVTSDNGSPTPPTVDDKDLSQTGNQQESHLSPDTGLVQVENTYSSDQQLVMSTSEFRDTNITVTDSTQKIISPDLLSENKGISEQSHTTSSELRETDSTQEIIIPDLLPENKGITEQRDTTSSELRETDSTQENGQHKQRESPFSENQDHTDTVESFGNFSLGVTTSVDSPEENNGLGCFVEEEGKISLAEIITSESSPTENSSLVQETVKCNSSVDPTNVSPEGCDFTLLQKTAPDPFVKDVTCDLREMSASPEHEDESSKSDVTSAHRGAIVSSSTEPMRLQTYPQADDKAGLSDWENPNTVPSPTLVAEDNTKINVSFVPQHLPISPETREAVLSPDHRRLSSFSDTTKGPISPEICELYSLSGSLMDAHFSEPPIIIPSPVGFTLSPSPELENKTWSAEPEALAFTPEIPEIDYRLTPTDFKGSVSSVDSKLCLTPDSRSITSTPESRPNVFTCELMPTAPSPELRSASCSPEIKTMTCNTLTQISMSPQIEEVAHRVVLPQNKVLAQTLDVEGIICAERFMPTTLSSKEITDMVIPTISNLSSTEGGISSPLSTSPRDTMSPDVEGTRYTESSKSTILFTNEITNLSVSPISNLSSTDGDISSPPSTLSIPRDTGSLPSTISILRNTVSPDVDGIRCVENPTSTTIPTNETTNMGISPISNLSSTEGDIFRPPSTLSIPRDTGSPPSTICIPRNTASPDVDRIRCVESSMSTTLPTNEIKNVALPISHLPSSLSIPRDTVSPNVDGIRFGESPTSTTNSTDGTTNIAISPITNFSSTEGGISRQPSTLSIPRDTMSPDVEGTIYTESSMPATLPTKEIKNVATPISHLPSSLSIPRDTVSSPKIRDQRSPDRFSDHISAQEHCIFLGEAEPFILQEYRGNHLSTTVNEKVNLPLTAPVNRGQVEDTGYKESFKSCSLSLDDCTDIASVPCSQIQKIRDLASEPAGTKLSVIQLKEGWERMNESMSDSIMHKKANSLNPWQTSKKMLTLPTAKEIDFLKGSDSGTEMLERESAGRGKQLGHMPVRPGESPSVLHSNNHSKYEGQSCRNKGWSVKREIQEEHTLGKGVGNIAEGSYRGEQVELSFSTRNRKGPANHSPVPSSRDPKSGIPARYFESPLATRWQQSLPRAQSLQKENKSGARRVRSTSQSNHIGAGRLPSECTSETSSMGSEFDEADSEVKWFTDQAFRSLSSPQVDYLDVYNSSHGSSTNVSQPSTLESSGSATWISYADLHDSLHENEDLLCHTSSLLSHGTLDPAKRFEMGSFECVDVAVESKEEARKEKRTVPKRQIQLKRRNFDELKSTENAGNVMDSLSTQICSRETLVRQHSTPASMKEDLFQGEPENQTGNKMLQKSASLDENSTKAKMASSIIKSVLSKKMDTATKESSRSSTPSEDKKKQPETLSAGESSNTERQSLSSNLPSECSLSSEDFAGKEVRSPCSEKRSCRPKVPPKPFFKPNCIPPNSNAAGVPFQGKTLVKHQVRPIMDDAFESKMPKKKIFENNDKEVNNVGEKYSSKSASAIIQTTNSPPTRAASTQGRVTNRDMKHPMTPETHKQQDSSWMFLSKTPEITLKPCTIKDNKSSLKAALSPELEISKDLICESQLEETPEERIRFTTDVEADNEEDKEKNKPKSVIHKVRDVRKLVKNTYNLSFKASNTTHHVEDVVNEKQKEMQHPHLLHIECKAISWKDKPASCNKSTNQPDAAHTADKSKMPQMDSVMRQDMGIAKITAKASLPKLMLESQEKQEKTTNVQDSGTGLFVGLDKCNSISNFSGNCEQSTKLEMPPRPSSKEISTLVFLQDVTPKTMQKPTSPALPDGKPASSSHSVSMLLKEKGMQADIGVCDVMNEGAGAKPKHINQLEVPLQTYASEGTLNGSQKVKKEEAALPCEQKTSINSTLQSSQGASLVRSSPKPKEVRIHPSARAEDNQSQGPLLQPPKELDMTVHANSVAKISTPLAASSEAEVRAFSSNTKIHAMPVTTSKEIELPIQVRSISSDRSKPSVLPKPNYKQPFAEIRSISTDFPKTDITPTTSIFKQQTHLKSDVKAIETSATVIHNEQSTEAASSNAKTLAVSAVSSHKPQTIPITTMSSSAQKSTTGSTSRQEVSITSVQNSSSRQQQNLTVIQERVMPATSCASNYQALPLVSQANIYPQPAITASSTDDFHFRTSDDPPSYDERESFSPMLLSDLPARRQNRYHPTTKHSLCSCTTCSHPQFGQHYHGLQNQTPPAPHSPGQVISYPGAPPQAQVRPHQCRPDGQPLNYPSVSPKNSVPQAPAIIQPMHHSHTCPAPAIQPYGNEQQQPSTQHMDRRSGNQRSPQAPSGAPYREHSHSPNIAALDHRSQFFNPQELPPSFSHEYGSDGPGGGGVLYPENASGLGYGQSPRRMLLDPETGKYFYIEVPMQPLRKMLFDPEIGQYVEVLIPQQAMSNSGMYPPTAAPYQGPYHGPGLYASQYLPYAVPPHPQSAQQPRHPEPSVPTSLHQNTMGYGSSASQAPKSDIKGHPSLDQSYLESMYYIPTGMNASPNSTPSDCYHKPSPNMPAAGGRRA